MSTAWNRFPCTGYPWPTPLNDNDADTRKTVQYFEMVGHRGIWHEGWKAVTFHNRGDGFRLGCLGSSINLDEDLAEIDDLGRPVSRKAGGAQGPLVAGSRTLWRASPRRCEPSGPASAGGRSPRTVGSCTRTPCCRTTSREGPGCVAFPIGSPPGISSVVPAR